MLALVNWALLSAQVSQFWVQVSVSVRSVVARQPEASGDLRMNMIIAAALVEGVALIAIVVCLLTLFL